MFDEVETGAQHFEQEQPQQQAEIPAEQPQMQQESQKEANMRILRERAELADRRSQESERRIQELERILQMNMNQQQTSTKMQIEEEDDFDLSDDSFVEGKHLRKQNKDVKRLTREIQELKQETAKSREEAAIANARSRIRTQYPDWEKVVNKDNLEKLREQDPETFEVLNSSKDTYAAGCAAYKFIKNSGIVDSTYSDVDKRLDDNRSKPRSAANASPQTGDTPLARVGDYDRRILTEDRKLQLRRQVEESKRYRN